MDIASITPTVCRLMHVDYPALSTAVPLRTVLAWSGPRPVERVLIYAPDAIGSALVRDYRAWFEPVQYSAPLAVRLRSMFPPKTPVCFASMFTGADPQEHGITGPVRPVLRCDTLFDALVRAGRKVALAAVKGSSIDLIFRERMLDYHSEEYDEAVTERALLLIAGGGHDLIVAYHQEYDDCLHRTSHRSPEALAAVRHHVASFAVLARAAEEHWRGQSYAVMFCPDHGAHDTAEGKGTHGDDIPEDMEVTHFFGLGRKA